MYVEEAIPCVVDCKDVVLIYPRDPRPCVVEIRVEVIELR
jgi:hypothetical protein